MINLFQYYKIIKNIYLIIYNNNYNKTKNKIRLSRYNLIYNLLIKFD